MVSCWFHYVLEFFTFTKYQFKTSKCSLNICQKKVLVWFRTGCTVLFPCPAVDVLRPMYCCLCLQAEGGKRAGAVATVLAAVDLARVRQPVHVEGGQADEEAVEVGSKQQGAAGMAAGQRYRAGRTTTRVQADQMLTTAQELRREPTLPPPQVREAKPKERQDYQEI